MASGDLSLTSNSSQEENLEYASFSDEQPIRPISNNSGSLVGNVGNHQCKSYDNIKQQYDHAKIELNNLRRQHNDTVRRCEEMASQLGFYQERYMAAMSRVETSTKDRSKYSDIANENARLLQQNLSLESKLHCFIDSMKQHEKDNGNNPIGFPFYDHYLDPTAKQCDGSCLASQKLLEEVQILKKKCGDLSKERNNFGIEKDKLRIQLTTAYTDLENAKREKNIFRDARDQLILQQDKEMEEMKALMATRASELLMTKIDRNRVEEELNQILSEKDNVLQETQRTSDALTAIRKELEIKLKDELKFKNEIKNLQQNNIELKQKLEQMANKLEKREILKSGENNWVKDGTESKDEFKEIEKLRKQYEKARSEVEKSKQETEVAKNRRDWAISEREKIVHERDSVKILCDELRRERDKAISDWLTAIRDSENIKMQKDEALKEIDTLREQLEQLSSSSKCIHRWNPSPYEFDELLEIELNNYKQDEDLGIILDDLNSHQLVCGISEMSPGYGKLKTNDVIIKVNNLDCQSISKRLVLEAIRASAPKCLLLIRRKKKSKLHLYIAHIKLQENRNHGISVETGVFISKIQPNSIANFDTNLEIGDRILSINNKTMEGIQSLKEATKVLGDHLNDSLTIFALKTVQDNVQNEIKRRMINTSAQTEWNDSVHKAIMTKQTSKISGIINKFRERIHAKNTGIDTDNFSQENDALAALDSVLSENFDKSKENSFKRSKRGKKDKFINKSLGTWPRAAILKTSQENPTGTIVHHRKKERVPLSLFTGSINVNDKEETENYFEQIIPQNQEKSMQSNILTKHNPNRNSNPIPLNTYQNNNITNAYLHRHSVYTTSLDTEPILFHDHSKSLQSNMLNSNPKLRFKMSDANMKNIINQKSQRNQYQNRFSLNLTPENYASYKSSGQTAQQQQPQLKNSLDFVPSKRVISEPINKNKNNFTTNNLDYKTNQSIGSFGNQQNSLDVISLKSQNSIDSFLSQKNSNIQDYVTNYTKRTSNKNVLKYPSDSESIGMEIFLSGQQSNNNTNTMPSTSLLFAPTAHRHTSLFPSLPGYLHSQPHRIRHSSPLTIPVLHGIENTNFVINSADKFDLDYIPYHTQNASADISCNRSRIQPTRDHEDGPTNYYNMHEGGTFPRKKEHQRFRIPSNQSVTSKGSGVKNSTGSIEHHGSERGSPMPPVHVEILSHGANKRNSNIADFVCPGDLRRVTIDKSDKPLGITIQCNNNGGGIFVSTVAEKSIASRAGLQVGDQLLEVCGINMRSATNDIAANVLRQCGNSITMLVQFNPEKYDGHNLEVENINHSGSPTPRNSPRLLRTLNLSSPSAQQSPLNNINILPQKTSQTSTQVKIKKFSDSLENQSDSSHHISADSIYDEESRLIKLRTEKCKDLGIKLLGGNKVGIFVHDVQTDSPADLGGIRKGDQILEYNGIDLRRVTAEQAANEISKLTDSITVLVQNNLQKLAQIQDKAGDSIYIRVGFDRTGDLGEGELRFVKDEVLYVDNTIFRGVFGQWRAWKLDPFGHRKECGLIPSQSKIEEELRLLGDSTDGDGNSTRRSSTSARRSFFRRKKHQRSSSRDSKELASFSNTQLSFFSDSGMLNDEGLILSYQRVERLDYPLCRPVLVLGPLSECVTDRLAIDFPLLFQHCIMTQMTCSQETIDEGLQKNIFVDYRRKGNIFECTTVESIRNICENNRHCILDVCISAVERLQRLKIYPIVLLLRFKSAKQIKEIKDSRYSTDKISAKAAKEMYERALKLESDYKQYISAVIPAGVNITHMSTQIKASVVEEQSHVLWVPASLT